MLRADLLSARGRGDVAARALVPCVRVWRIVSIQARSQISTRLLGSLRILLRHTQPPEPALAELQNALATLPDDDDLVTDVQHRRARFLDDIAAPRTTLSEALGRRVHAAMRDALEPAAARHVRGSVGRRGATVAGEGGRGR